jgi:ubiquinone/menaquinone biosynthesis C-methylase UbiE
MSTPNFNKIAHAYRWLEYLSFGPLLHRCRTEYLKEVMPAQHALILGDGDGRFTSRLLSTNEQITIHALDCSTTMLSLLWKRACAHKAQKRLILQQIDVRCFFPQNKYDLVVSHFFLDCLTDIELRAVIRNIKPFLSPKTLWAVSEFAIPTTPWRNKLATLLISGLYIAFGWLTGLHVRHLPNHALILTEEGFLLKNERQRLGGLLVSQLWQLRS